MSEEKKEKISDRAMFDGYKRYKKFLDHPEDLTEEEKRKLRDICVNI